MEPWFYTAALTVLWLVSLATGWFARAYFEKLYRLRMAETWLKEIAAIHEATLKEEHHVSVAWDERLGDPPPDTKGDTRVN